MAEANNINFFGRTEEQKLNILDKVSTELDKINKQALLDKIDIPKIESNINHAYDRMNMIAHLWETYVIADILGYVFVGFLVLFFVAIAYLLRQYAIALYSSSFLAIIFLIIGPSFMKDMIDKMARSSKIENLRIQKFDYSSNVVITADLINTGKFDYMECVTNMVFHKTSLRGPITFVNKLKPIYQKRIVFKDIKQKEYKHISYTIYSIPKDINFSVSIDTKCH